MRSRRPGRGLPLRSAKIATFLGSSPTSSRRTSTPTGPARARRRTRGPPRPSCHAPARPPHAGPCSHDASTRRPASAPTSTAGNVELVQTLGPLGSRCDEPTAVWRPLKGRRAAGTAAPAGRDLPDRCDRARDSGPRDRLGGPERGERSMGVARRLSPNTATGRLVHRGFGGGDSSPEAPDPGPKNDGRALRPPRRSSGLNSAEFGPNQPKDQLRGSVRNTRFAGIKVHHIELEQSPCKR